MPKRKLTVAAIQLNARDDKPKNLASACRLVDRATALGADVVLLPEVFNYTSSITAMVKNAENIGGKTINTLKKSAKKNQIHLICGSILEKARARKAYNACVAMTPKGEIMQIYRKTHLFDVDVTGEITFSESQGVEAGNELITFNIEGITAGIAICYDLRFPELFRILAMRGAQVIFLPAAFTEATGRYHWEPLLKARAIENQVFIVAANQYGMHPNGIKTYGRSMILDPYGRVLAEAGRDGETIITATLDMNLLKNVRKEMPLFKQRRGDLYEIRS